MRQNIPERPARARRRNSYPASSADLLVPARTALGRGHRNSRSRSLDSVRDYTPAPLLGFIARDTPLPGGAHDPQLTAKGKTACVLAYLAAPSKQPIATHRATLEEVQMLPDPASWYPRDPRWLEVYGSELMRALVDWVGCSAILMRSSASSDRTFSSRYTLGDLVVILERRFETLLSREIERFWRDAAAATSPLQLQTPANFSLQFVLMMTCLLAYMYMGRKMSARQFMREAVAQMRATRIPGEQGATKRPEDMDEFLFQQLWVGTFWMIVMVEQAIAAGTRTSAFFNPAEDFPTAPFLYPIFDIATIPAPSKRPPKAPIPSDLLARAPKFNCSEYLAWLDPTTRLPVDEAATELAIKSCVAEVKTVGALHMGAMMATCLERVLDYSRWLREEGKMTLLCVLIAEDLKSKGAIHSHKPVMPVGMKGNAAKRLTEIIQSPMLAEAVRRRNFLMNNLKRIEDAFPEDIRAAVRTGDWKALENALPNWVPGAVQTILGFLALFRLCGMLLNCPEPFESPSKSLIGSTDEANQDMEQSAETMMELYFTSFSFAEAARLAMLISNNLRLTLTHFPRNQLETELFSHIQAFASTHAAWFHVLVLKRFRSLVVRAPAAEQAAALDLYSAVVDDVNTCLEMLGATGQRQHVAVRDLLQSMLEGEDVALSRADIQMLRLSRQIRPSCPHLELGDVDGYCWICATERLKLQQQPQAPVPQEGHEWGPTRLQGRTSKLAAGREQHELWLLWRVFWLRRISGTVYHGSAGANRRDLDKRSSDCLLDALQFASPVPQKEAGQVCPASASI